MQTFPTILKSLIVKDNRTASAIAEEAGFNASILSKISSGAVSPDPQTVAKLLKVFELKKRHALIAAWLEDRAAEIGVSPDELMAAFSVNDGLVVPLSIRQDLALIIKRGGDTREFREAIRAVAACLVAPAEDIREVAEGPGPTDLPPRREVSYRRKKS